MAEEMEAPPNIQLYGEYSSIFKTDGKWTLGVYKLPDGTSQTYNEPDAVIIVQRNRLRIRAEPLTRSHDTIQQLDNNKHVYLSTSKFPTPDEGIISFEVRMQAKVTNAKDNDLYNAFTSFGLHDLEAGFGFSFLTNGLEYATLYSREAPTGATSRNPTYPRFFHIYDEHTLTEGQHQFTINYNKSKNTVEWLLDGEKVNYQDAIPDPINNLNISLGLKAAIDLGPNGSQSLHGQGITGEWSQVKITGPSPQ